MTTLPAGQPAKIATPVTANARIVLSPSCSAALVYAPGKSAALLISGLPSALSSQAASLTSSGPMAGAAVSDAGSILFATLSADGSASVQMLPASGTAQMVKQVQRFGALAFLPGSDTALIADAGANAVFLGTQLASSPAFTQIAANAQGVVNPVAIAASADAHYAFVVNGSGTSLLRLDLSGASAPATVTCACTARELLPLFGNANFQLTDPAAGTIFALEGDAQTPQTIFIPTDNIGATRAVAR
jgi:hypothetical protein